MIRLETRNLYAGAILEPPMAQPELSLGDLQARMALRAMAPSPERSGAVKSSTHPARRARPSEPEYTVHRPVARLVSPTPPVADGRCPYCRGTSLEADRGWLGNLARQQGVCSVCGTRILRLTA